MMRTRLLYALLAAVLPMTGLAASAPNPMAPLIGRSGAAEPLDPMAALLAGSTEAEAAGNPELGGLPDGKGAEETFYQCTACHSTEIIKQQRVTDARWDDLWKWMVEAQGMYEPDPEEKTLILGYLKTHFSSQR